MPPDWLILDHPAKITRISRYGRFVEKLKRAAALVLVRLQPRLAEVVYWYYCADSRTLCDIASTVDADLWLANDWSSLPIASWLARKKGGVYAYDSHEFAREEFAERPWWRFWKRPLVCAIEERFIRGAAVVSAVSPGVAERLDRLYPSHNRSLVIRNTPRYEEASFRPTGERIRVLYHGIVAPGRGLEATIDSVPSWRPEFDFIIRGPANTDFREALRARIAKLGITHRVTLLPPVPMLELVREAMAFDIGLFALPDHSHHNAFALPNKFFEYVMAGLALCVSELPEMSRLVHQYGLGVLISHVEPAAIAAAINGLDRQRIDSFKCASLRAARELCWEREPGRMLEAYAGLMQPAAAGQKLGNAYSGYRRWADGGDGA